MVPYLLSVPNRHCSVLLFLDSNQQLDDSQNEWGRASKHTGTHDDISLAVVDEGA